MFLRQLLTNPLPEPNEPSPTFLISFYVRPILILISHLLLVPRNFLFPFAFTPAVFFFVGATRFPHLFYLEFITFVTFDDEYKLRNSAL
jgi:hypothetical protein